jgi:hypothetical protein
MFKARLTIFALKDPEPPLPRLLLPTRVGPVPPSWCLLVSRALAFLLALSHIQHTQLGSWLSPVPDQKSASPAPGVCKGHKSLRSGRGGRGLCRKESKLVLWRQGVYSRLLSLGSGLNLFGGHISEVGTATVLSATGESYI